MSETKKPDADKVKPAPGKSTAATAKSDELTEAQLDKATGGIIIVGGRS